MVILVYYHFSVTVHVQGKFITEYFLFLITSSVQLAILYIMPCTDAMHSPAFPSTKTQIRPHLTYRHRDYMILLLHVKQIYQYSTTCHCNSKIENCVFFIPAPLIHGHWSYNSTLKHSKTDELIPV